MQEQGLIAAAEQVLSAAEAMESQLRRGKAVPEHLLKHFAKRIWELRVAMVAPHQALENLQRSLKVVQNNIDVLDHYVAGGFTFEDSWDSSIATADELAAFRQKSDG